MLSSETADIANCVTLEGIAAIVTLIGSEYNSEDPSKLLFSYTALDAATLIRYDAP